MIILMEMENDDIDDANKKNSNYQTLWNIVAP